MDTATTIISLLARAAERAGVRSGPLGLVVLATAALAFAVGAVVADLLALASEPVLVAPFRW
jgi:hypothetical protein